MTENHVYAGVGGRLSKRTTSVASGHSYFGGESFDTSWAYDPRGEVSSVTYPRCTHSVCDVAGTGDPNRTVSFGYGQGWLETIYGYGTWTLHPNGMVHRVDHSNSRRDVYLADPYGMARPSNVQVVDSVSGGVIVDLGLHQYDPVGNLMTRGGERYHYDLAGHLARYQAAGGGYQIYGFDGFGNLTSTYKSALAGPVTL